MDSTGTMHFTNEATDGVISFNNTTPMSPPEKNTKYPNGWDGNDILYLRFILNFRFGICSLAFVMNIIVLILQIKVRSFRRTHYVFAMVLTISDIIHATDIFGETYFFRKGIEKPSYWFGAIASASGLLSCLSIVAVAVDRYLALCAIPFRYKQVVTIKKYWFVIAIMFSVSIMWGCTLFSFLSYRDLVFTYISITVPSFMVALTCTVYIRLSYLVSKSLRGFEFPDAIKRQRHAQTKRILIAFGTILATNVLFVLPQSSFSLYIALQPPANRYSVFKHVALGNCMYSITTMNTCANPLIFWHQVLVKEMQLPSFGTFCTRTGPYSPNVTSNETQ